MRRSLIAGLVLLFTACTTAAPSPSASASSGSKVGGTVTFAAITDPETLDLHQTSNPVASTIFGYIYEPLVYQDLDNSYKGLLAESWTVSPDNKTMMESIGNWDFANVYIDEKASPEQRKALEAIARDTLPPVAPPDRTKIKYVPITRKVEGSEHLITIGSIGSFRSRARRTTRNPGSEITGIPASLTIAITSPPAIFSITFSACDSSLCSCRLCVGVEIPKLVSSLRVCRVSSQRITLADFSASIARGERSERFPIGVPTMSSFPGTRRSLLQPLLRRGHLALELVR